MMKHSARKITKDVYEYRGTIIKKDVIHPDGPWLIFYRGQVEGFAHRAQGMIQVDRYLSTLAEITRAPSEAQLKALDLSDYLSNTMITDVQARIYDTGHGASATREQVVTEAGLGGDGTIKRLLVAIIAWPYYELAK